MNRAAHKGFLGVTDCEPGDLYGFSNNSNSNYQISIAPYASYRGELDYADDVSLLASLALEILHEESSQIGLEINWSKTKLIVFDDTSTPPSKVSVLDHDFEVVDSFVYLGSCTDVHGGTEPDICRRIEKARSCMKSLDRNIWRSSVSLHTNIRLYNVYILQYFFIGVCTIYNIL